jgi:hypothetical protein
MAKKYYVDGKVFKDAPGRNTSFIGQANPIYLNEIIEEVVGITLPVVPATTTVQGIVELATNAEAIAGVSTTVVITPASLAAAMATIGDLESVLTNGNSTGANDIEITLGQTIKSSAGDASLNLHYGAPNNFMLSSDNAGGAESYVQGNPTYASLGYGPDNAVNVNDSHARFLTSITTCASYMDVASAGVYDLTGPAVNSTILVTSDNASNVSNNCGGNVAVFINTGNSVDSQINQNVNNSVIVGGDGITAKTDNTAYVNQVGFNNNGESFEGLMYAETLTADRTYELPNASGNVCILRTVFTAINHNAQDGEVVLATSGGAGITVTLPDPTTKDNMKITVKKVDAGVGALNVASPAGTFDGVASPYVGLIGQNNSVTVVSAGGNWFILAAV